MKICAFAFFGFGAALVALTGCAQLDLTPESSPDRVLTGTVTARALLPVGTQVVIRVVDRANRPPVRGATADLPVERTVPLAAPVELILAEQSLTLEAATNEPVPFRIEYRATDAMLRYGLNVEARISHDGKVRHRNVSAHVLTLGSSPFPLEVVVDPVQ